MLSHFLIKKNCPISDYVLEGSEGTPFAGEFVFLCPLVLHTGHFSSLLNSWFPFMIFFFKITLIFLFDLHWDTNFFFLSIIIIFMEIILNLC